MIDQELMRTVEAEFETQIDAYMKEWEATLNSRMERSAQFADSSGLVEKQVTRRGIVDGKAFADGGPPGPPPRPGLEWKPSTHRWINPETGEEHNHDGSPVATADSDPVERAWRDQGISVSPEYRAKVLPQLQAVYDKYADRVRVDKRQLRELIDDDGGRTPDQVWQEVSQIGGDDLNVALDWDHVLTGTDRLRGAILQAASRFGGGEDDWEDAANTWLDRQLRQRVQASKDEIMAALGGKQFADSSGLVEKQVTVHRADGTTFQRTQMVRPDETGDGPHEDHDGTPGGLDHAATSKAGRILKALAGLPAAAVAKAKAKVAASYAKLEKRYGKGYAKAIIAAGLTGLPIPAPGASFLMAAPVLAVAELHRQLSGSKQMADTPVDLTSPEFAAAVRGFIAEITAPDPQAKQFAEEMQTYSDVTPEKAREILHDGTVHGEPLTEKQRNYFGYLAGQG